jgi:hypothetical protein
VTDIYKTAYDAERLEADLPETDQTDEHADAKRADAMGEVSNTIERSMKAARETFDEVSARASTSERPRELTREVEDAVAISLRELGGALQRLSEQIGRERDDAGDANGRDDDQLSA